MNSGSVSGTRRVGGLIGYGQNQSTITNSMNSGSVSGTSNVGGLIGYGTTTITNSMNSGSVSGTSSNVGGLIGSSSFGGNNTITNSMNSGSVSGTSNVGGLIGYGSSTTITNSMNSGSISGSSVLVISSVGGLIGYGQNTTITNSMNSGSVSGYSRVGGLIGSAENRLFIYYSVNFGNVIATANATAVGGITGFLPTTNDIEQTYFSGTITSNGVVVDGVAFGTKVTDLNTFNLAFFTTTLEWDTEIWDFTGLDIANGVYPNLKNMPEEELSLELAQLKQNLEKLQLGNFTLDFQTPGICEPTSCSYKVTSDKLYAKINSYETYAFKEGEGYRSMFRFSSTFSWSVSDRSEESFNSLGNEILPFNPFLDHLFSDNKDGTFSIESQNIKEFIIRDSIEDSIVSILVIPSEDYLTLIFEFNNGVKHTYKYLNYGTTIIDIPIIN